MWFVGYCHAVCNVSVDSCLAILPLCRVKGRGMFVTLYVRVLLCVSHGCHILGAVYIITRLALHGQCIVVVIQLYVVRCSVGGCASLTYHLAWC